MTAPRGVFEFEPTLTTAETASVFGETLVLERMLAEADDRGRLSLLALSAFSRYREVGPGFAARLLAMLAEGGSRSPQQLAVIIDVDLTDPGSGRRAWRS